VVGRSGECSKRNPQEGSLFLRESKTERKNKALGRLEKRRVPCFVFIPRPGTHPRTAPVDSPRSPRGRSARCADGPAPRRGQSVIHSRTSSTAPLPTEPCEQSASPWRTVRQERTDSPAHRREQSDLPFLFQLDKFRDKDLKKYLLGSLLKNNKGNLSYDAMYQTMLGKICKSKLQEN
jgi:hypothetical protein